MAKKAVDKTDRRTVIKNRVLDVIEKHQPELNRSFDMQKIVELPGTRGLLRKSLPDFKHEEKKIFREVVQELKNDKILFHKSGSQWVRLS